MNASQILKLKHLYGNAKISDDIAYSNKGKEYKFSDDFIEKLDLYFQGKIDFKTISVADKKNIDKFISFADGKVLDNDKDYEMYKKFNLYLGSL